MATPSLTTLPIERIERLERQIAVTRLWILLSMGLNLLLVGLGLQHYGFHLASRTIEARKIVLTDPARHPLGIIGVDNNWDNIPSKTYHPGIEFQDEKGERKMVLFGTGVYFNEGEKSANLSFTGLDINDKSTMILVNVDTLSFSSNKGQFLLFPHSDGLDLTLGDGDNEFGVNTGHKGATMFVASRKGEVDITADESGTRVERVKKGPSSQ